MEGIPEITLNISSSCLDFLVVHPCVLEGDTHVQIPSFQPSQMLKGPELVGRKVRFRPPTESFHLCHYSSKTPYGLPVRGIYQMQVRGGVDFLVGNFVASEFTVGTISCRDIKRGQAVLCVRIRYMLKVQYTSWNTKRMLVYFYVLHLVLTVCKGSVH